jgi:hypothetical protein
MESARLIKFPALLQKTKWWAKQKGVSHTLGGLSVHYSEKLLKYLFAFAG